LLTLFYFYSFFKEDKISIEDDKNDPVTTISTNENNNKVDKKTRVFEKYANKIVLDNKINRMFVQGSSSTSYYSDHNELLIEKGDWQEEEENIEIQREAIDKEDDSINDKHFTKSPNNNETSDESLIQYQLRSKTKSIMSSFSSMSSQQNNGIPIEEKKRVLSDDELNRLKISSKFMNEVRNMVYVPKTNSFYPRSVAKYLSFI
jgi:hypothetical protein